MIKKNNIDLWDGFDNTESVYDDRKEKQFHSRIWVVLVLVAGGMLLSLFWQLGKDLVYKTRGTAIVADYEKDATKCYARYYDEDRNLYTYNMSDFFAPKADGDKIVLYYLTDLTEVRPMSLLSVWLVYFSFFSVMFGICIWRLYRIWHPKTHVPIEKREN